MLFIIMHRFSYTVSSNSLGAIKQTDKRSSLPWYPARYTEGRETFYEFCFANCNSAQQQQQRRQEQQCQFEPWIPQKASGIQLHRGMQPCERDKQGG